MLTGEAVIVEPGVWTGVSFSRHNRVQVYVKTLTPRKLVVELLCALVGRAQDLPIPRPHMLMANAEDLPESGLAPGTHWVFGSEDAQLPALARITRDPDEIARRLRQWKRVDEVAAFDSWTGNEDRTAKNLLCSTDSARLALIDHDDALPDWLTADAETTNQVLALLTEGAAELDRQRRRKSAMAATAGYDRIDWNTASTPANWAARMSANDDLLSLVTLLENRVPHLPRLLAAAAGIKQQDIRYAHSESRR